ncbi:UNVERIFIED_CONTAM: hypothetical protein FKN15_060164 [Acipenser sinensis]
MTRLRLVFSTLQVVVSIFLLVSCCPASLAAGEFDPYTVLGVGRSATQAEVKKVYKKLAREWSTLLYQKQCEITYLAHMTPGPEPGMGIGVVDVGYERRLANHLGAHRTPSILGLINGKVTFFHYAVVREHLRQFVENLLPARLVEKARGMKKQIIDEFISNNKFLLVPRLVNQKLFEELCPVKQFHRRRKYCVLLVTSGEDSFTNGNEEFLSFAASNTKEIFRFAYVYQKQQQALCDVLLKDKESVPSQVLILERRNTAGKMFLLQWIYAAYHYVSQIGDDLLYNNWREMMPLMSLIFSALFILFGTVVIKAFRSLTLHFSFLNLDKHKEWMESLLEFAQDAVQIDSDEDDSQHKADYTGYVLALNGHKKYLCLFKPVYTGEDLHMDSSRASSSSRDEAATRKKTASSSLQIHHKLDRLGLWIERLLEGTLPRYYIPSWPGLDKITTSK